MSKIPTILPEEKFMTEREFLQLPHDGRKWEFVAGKARATLMGCRQSAVRALIVYFLSQHTRRNGRLTCGHAAFRMTNGSIRCPNISFTTKNRLLEEDLTDDVGTGAPDLCVEIISSSEEAGEMRDKLEEYFASGAIVVWHVFPEAERVTVYRQGSVKTSTLRGGESRAARSTDESDLHGIINKAYMIATKCYKYRLKPTAEQEAVFVQWAGCRRFVWNYALAKRKQAYKDEGKSIPYNALAAEIVKLKKEPGTAFLKECQSQLLQQTLMDLDKGYKAFFEKCARLPKFKSRRKTSHSFRIPQNVLVVGQGVSVPKIGLVKAIIHRALVGEVKSATIKQESDGHWYVVFVAHQEIADAPATCLNPVGIDVGLESLVTTHEGVKIEPPKFFRKGEAKLKRLSRKLSRCQKDSKNRGKAKKRLCAHHRKMRNKRDDFLHKLSAKLVAMYDTVCVEDLCLKGLARTKLAKSFADASLGWLLKMLEYKCAFRRGQVVKVGRFFPSSKTCSDCGTRKHLELSDRKWVCECCGVLHDRDINAAINILREGLRTLQFPAMSKFPVGYGNL